VPNRAQILKQNYQKSIGLPFAAVFGETFIESVLQTQAVQYRPILYTPMVTIWAWLSQVWDSDKSLSQGVSRVIAWMAEAQAPLPSSDTGGYSKARKRLPLKVISALLHQSGVALTAQVKPQHTWCGRVVKAFDGTSVQMNDTAANQRAYPQHSN
jgi:hypothetical protein